MTLRPDEGEIFRALFLANAPFAFARSRFPRRARHGRVRVVVPGRIIPPDRPLRVRRRRSRRRGSRRRGSRRFDSRAFSFSFSFSFARLRRLHLRPRPRLARSSLALKLSTHRRPPLHHLAHSTLARLQPTHRRRRRRRRERRERRDRRPHPALRRGRANISRSLSRARRRAHGRQSRASRARRVVARALRRQLPERAAPIVVSSSLVRRRARVDARSTTIVTVDLSTTRACATRASRRRARDGRARDRIARHRASTRSRTRRGDSRRERPRERRERTRSRVDAVLERRSLTSSARWARAMGARDGRDEYRLSIYSHVLIRVQYTCR